MLGNVLTRFVENRPMSVRVRGTLERVLGAEQRDAWFARTANKPSTRTLVFATVSDLLSHVVFRIKPSVRAAYRDRQDEGGASRMSVSNKRKGVATHTSAALVRESASVLRPLMAPLDGVRASWWPGYRGNILDGHGLAARERRLKAWRQVQGGAVPGQSLVVSEPAHGLVRAVFLGEDGQAQARSMLAPVRETVQADDLWMHDRHGCPWALLWAIDRRGAACITRQPQGLPCERRHAWRSVGRLETGPVAAPRVQVWEEPGGAPLWRRLRVQRDEATRDGARERYILTNGPLRKASAQRVARFSRKRWTLETACQPLEAYFPSAIHTWGSPKAAVCGFCLALVASNRLAVVTAALRSVPGAESMDRERSLYDVANDSAPTDPGMMMAIPEPAWRVFSRRRPAEMVATLRELAQTVRLKAYRKRSRGPKKPQPKCAGTTKSSHVSTAKILRNRQVNAATP